MPHTHPNCRVFGPWQSRPGGAPRAGFEYVKTGEANDIWHGWWIMLPIDPACRAIAMEDARKHAADTSAAVVRAETAARIARDAAAARAAAERAAQAAADAVIGRPLVGDFGIGGGPEAHRARALGDWQSDNAYDLLTRRGTLVLAVTSGTIGRTGGSYVRGGGKLNGYKLTLFGANNAWFYTHMISLSVTDGQRVAKGTVLGRSGDANGVDHLHIGQQFGDPAIVFRTPQLAGPASRAEPEELEREVTVEQVRARQQARQLDADESVAGGGLPDAWGRLTHVLAATLPNVAQVIASTKAKIIQSTGL